MDWFTICLIGFSLIGQSAVQIRFIGRLTGRKSKARHFVLYFLLLCAIEWGCGRTALGGIPAVGLQVLTLYGTSRFVMKTSRPTSGTAAVIAVYVTQLSFGIVNSIEAIVFPQIIGSPMLYPLLFFATLLSFGLCVSCCAAVLRLLSLKEGKESPYVGLLLIPGLFFFSVELYILQSSYSGISSSLSDVEVWKHAALLLLQTMGLGTLLCTLYAYRHICSGFQMQAALDSLAQAACAQKVYIMEAQKRYERTKAFRHDIQNHLSVLAGLLNSGRTEEGKAYLQDLTETSSMLSFPYHTGNPVVDIVLSEKLSLAKEEGITADISLLLPSSCGIDDLDLCVIFSNALDNAIQACRMVGGGIIRITGERQGDFYRLSFENTALPGPMPPGGTGLSNIRSAAEKYHGAILTEKEEGRFSLHVLLNIS